MAETSKNKIYYNDNENIEADVLTDMKKMAESTDEAIEKSKYNDAAIKKSISDVEKKQVEKNTEQDSKIVELQTEKAKLETELKEMQEDFYQNSIRGQASGEYIHVEDSSNCRARIGISGNSRQEVVTDNLFNNTWRQGIIASETGVEIDSTENIRSSSVEVHASHLYSISRSICTSYMSFRFYTKDGTYLGNQSTEGIMTTSNTDKRMNANESSMTFTITNANVAKMRIVDNSNNLTTKYTLTTDTINPDYPSEIKTVGSNVNLFDVAQMKQTILVGTSDFIYLTKKPNTKYTLSTSLPLAGNNTADIFLISGHTTVGTTTDNGVWKGNSRTITSDRNGYLTIAYRKQNVSSWTNLTSYKYKLVEGTEVGEYSKYGQGCVKVTKCNEMLYNKDIITLQNGLWANNTSGVIQNNVSGWYIVLPINGGKKYRIAKKNAGLIGVATTVTKPENGVNLVDKFDYENSITSKEIQTSKSAKYLFIGLFAGTPTEEQKISIIEGLKVVSEDYQEQSYILPIQQEMLEGDYFDWDNEEEVHTWGKYIFTGEENMTKSGVEANNSYWINQNSIPDLLNAELLNNFTTGTIVPNFLSTHFKTLAPLYVTDHNNIGATLCANNYNLKDVTIRFGFGKDSDIDTADKCKAWLKTQYNAGTPLIAYYKLATPNRLKFTDEQKAVAKELNNARTYKNVTNITTDSKAILSLDYVKAQETQNQKMQNEIDEIKQLLSTTQTSAMLLDNLQKEVESEVE